MRLAGLQPKRMTPARARVLALFADGLARAKGDAAREAGASTGVIDGLIDEGTLATLVLPPEPVTQPPDPDFRKPEFSGGTASLKIDGLAKNQKLAGNKLTLTASSQGKGLEQVITVA